MLKLVNLDTFYIRGLKTVNLACMFTFSLFISLKHFILYSSTDFKQFLIYLLTRKPLCELSHIPGLSKLITRR